MFLRFVLEKYPHLLGTLCNWRCEYDTSTCVLMEPSVFKDYAMICSVYGYLLNSVLTGIAVLSISLLLISVSLFPYCKGD